MANLVIPFNYDIYGTTEQEQTAFRNTLNVRICSHYLMREIGYETVELWRVMLEERLNLIMPTYQQLYQTTLFQLDLDNPYHLITTHDQKEDDERNITKNGTDNRTQNLADATQYGSKESRTNQSDINTTTSTNGESTTDTIHSDFPQASFAQGDYASSEDKGSETHNDKVVQSGGSSGNDSLTRSGTDTVNHTGTDNRTFGDNTEDINNNLLQYLHDVKGHTSNMEILDAIEKWRNLILNINEMIVDELNNMFIQLF